MDTINRAERRVLRYQSRVFVVIIIGKFTRQERVEPSCDPGPLGQPATWENCETAWAEVYPFGSVAKARYQGIASTWSHMLKFHGVVDYTITDRFIWVNNGNKVMIPKEPPSDPDESQRFTIAIVAATKEVDDG